MQHDITITSSEYVSAYACGEDKKQKKCQAVILNQKIQVPRSFSTPT